MYMHSVEILAGFNLTVQRHTAKFSAITTIIRPLPTIQNIRAERSVGDNFNQRNLSTKAVYRKFNITTRTAARTVAL